MTLLGLAVWSVFHSTPQPEKPPLQPLRAGKVATTPYRIPSGLLSGPIATTPILTTPVTTGLNAKAPNTKGREVPERNSKRPLTPVVKKVAPNTAGVTASLPVDDAAEEARLCSLSVNGGSVEFVVRTLVAQSRLNLVLLGGQKTPVTLNLRKVPLIEAVRHLCVAGNLRFVRLPHTLAIGPEETLKTNYAAEWAAQYPAPTVEVPEAPKLQASITKIVHLAHIPAPAAVVTLEGVFKERGLVAVVAPRATVPTLSGVETGSTGAAANTGIAGTSESASRSLVLYGPPEVVTAAESLLRGLDTPRAQVQVAVTMHDVSNAALKDLGISWTFNQVSLTEREDRSFLFGKFDRTNLGFNAVIRALETADQARLIASPNVSVQDGERGFVLIGDRLVFPELIGYSQANTPIFSTKQERVGVYLQVSATVAPDGYVTMTIAPQVSTVRGFLDVGGTSYPQIATREAQSTLRIKSGDTIVMGGLMRDDEIATMERVPILADLPILGELFKRRKRSKTASQLVISVTPTVVAP